MNCLALIPTLKGAGRHCYRRQAATEGGFRCKSDPDPVNNLTVCRSQQADRVVATHNPEQDSKAGVVLDNSRAEAAHSLLGVQYNRVAEAHSRAEVGKLRRAEAECKLAAHNRAAAYSPG